MKTCAKCGIEKKLAEFGLRSEHKDGLHSYCKVCARAANKTYRDCYQYSAGKHDSEIIKTCLKCGIEKVLTEFCLHKGHKDGRSSWCRVCTRVVIKAYNKSDVGKKWWRLYSASEKRKKINRKYNTSKKGKENSHRGKQKHRALKLNATIGPIDEAAIYEQCGNKCTYCGSKEKLSLDHVVALAAGGVHTQENLTVACKSCNSSKGAKPVAEWLAARC